MISSNRMKEQMITSKMCIKCGGAPSGAVLSAQRLGAQLYFMCDSLVYKELHFKL